MVFHRAGFENSLDDRSTNGGIWEKKYFKLMSHKTSKSTIFELARFSSGSIPKTTGSAGSAFSPPVAST